MDRVTIDVSKSELNFIREALETKHINLMNYLETCEKQSAEEAHAENKLWNLVQDIAKDEFEKELENVSKAMEDAPFGLKKDGTAKAKPGRKRLIIKRNKKKAEVKSDV